MALLTYTNSARILELDKLQTPSKRQLFFTIRQFTLTVNHGLGPLLGWLHYSLYLGVFSSLGDLIFTLLIGYLMLWRSTRLLYVFYEEHVKFWVLDLPMSIELALRTEDLAALGARVV